MFKSSLISFLFIQLTLFVQVWSGGVAVAQNLLPEGEAFQFTATRASDNRILATWEIADDYYMYKDKVRFEFSGNSLITSKPVLPNGTFKQDALFGKVEVYTGSFSVELPVSIVKTTAFELIAFGQGCNEPVGVCYPPMRRKINIAANEWESTVIGARLITSETSPQGNFSDVDSANDLRALLSSSFKQAEFLDVNDAFKLRIEAISKSKIKADFQIADGYYLYKDKISFSDDDGNLFDSVEFPQGKLKTDEYFGEVFIFDEDFSTVVDLHADIDDTIIYANYQGCADDGICYSPVYQTFDLSGFSDNLPAEQASFSVNSERVNSEIVNAETVNLESDGSDGNVAREKPLITLLFGAFLAGILLTFTPCVLPMIPILSSIIAGQGESMNRARGGLLALIYVLGTAVTYAAMGALAGATGDQLQAYFQNIWAIGLLCGFFILMALSMFGLFEFQMPAAIQEKIQSNTRHWGGSLPMVFLLGLLSALIIGACVSPVLISVLGIAVSSGDPYLGAKLMFAMALGMGLPLIALGIGAGHFIPKAGPWMEKIKHAFGVMLIAVAIYFSGTLPQVPVLLLWGGFFIILSVFLGATHRPDHLPSNWQKLAKGAGLVLLIWGAVLIIGGLLGQRDMLRPIPPSLFGNTTIQDNSSGNAINRETIPLFTTISSMEALQQNLDLAKSTNKKVLIDYYADWCVDCLRMEKTTFADSRVIEKINADFLALKIDVTDPKNTAGKALKKKYNVFGPPATLFIDGNGQVIKEKRFYGYMDADSFLSLIDSL